MNEIVEPLDNEVIMSTRQGLDRMAKLAASRKPRVFSLRTRGLKSGGADTIVSATPSQWIWIKCYASGGENELHAHVHEDHTFICLQGEVVFRGPKGEKLSVRRHEGFTIPAGNVYSFEVASKENLVLLRIGSPTGTGDPGFRVDEHGKALDAFVAAKPLPVFSDEWFFD